MSITQTMRTLEGKGLIRRVRTAAGVARFGQPIGTIITRDMIEASRKKRVSKNSYRLAARAASSSKGKTPATLRWKDVTDKGSSIKKRETTYGKYTIRLTGGTRAGESRERWHVNLYSPESSSFAAGVVQVPDRYSSTEAAAKKWVKEKYIPSLPVEAKRFPRQVESLFDYWDGVYGVDWSWDEDNINEDELANDEDDVYRIALAMRESDALGIEVNGASNLGGDTWFIDPAVHEVVNANARAYDSMYPGFNLLLKQYEIDPSTTAYGWNQMQYERTADGNIDPRQTQITKMGLGAAYFAQGWEEIDAYGPGRNRVVDPLGALAASKRSGSKARWNSLDFDAVQEENGLEDWQVAALNTINHEIGHTIGRAITGELKQVGIDRSYYREEYARRIGAILTEYGIIDDDGSEGFNSLMGIDTRDIYQTGAGGGWKIQINKTAVKEHLSEYGATSLHELMADTWASYMLDPSPTEFVQDAGAAMDELWQLWLEEWTEAREREGR